MLSNVTTKPLFLDSVGYLLTSNLKNNPAAPKSFWSLTFPRSLRNHLQIHESNSFNLHFANIDKSTFP